MGSLLEDRMSAILYYIEQWRVNDPQLENKIGFLKYLTTCDLGCFNVGNTKVWMNYLKEAKKQGIGVAELLFEKQRKIQSISSKREKKPIEKRIFILNEDSRKEMEEIDERLKLQDPLRRKQLEKQYKI
jgi:hypothetical protein